MDLNLNLLYVEINRMYEVLLILCEKLKVIEKRVDELLSD